MDTPLLTDRQNMNDLFNLIWPYLERELQTFKTEQELADRLNLELIQVRTWLQRAMNDGKVTKLKRPVRYITASQQSYTLL
jgi:hypothetical protein